MEQVDAKVEQFCPWYAVRLFSLKLTEIEEYFKQHGYETFVPRQWQVSEGHGGKPMRQLRPVVHNLLFVKKATDEQQMRRVVAESSYKMSVIRKTADDPAYYEIPAKQMIEFQMMCNPDISIREYLTEQEARMKVGTEVLVKFGPLKGLSGRLVRISKKYYLLKEVPGMGVALKVSRWCCVPIDENLTKN